MELSSKILTYIKNQQLLSTNDKILVGVSGGIDSVVLLNILLKLNYECVVAHCNFHLRGTESDRDKIFVENLTTNYGIMFKTIDFDTQAYAKSNKISIEMAARELRYKWFEQVASEMKCTKIAVAHHQDDSTETMLLNLIRGTGIKGITGIEPKNGNIIRPLLCCSRCEIESYANNQKLNHIYDSSNSENKYVRNKIRNQILPLMAEINPSINNTLTENMMRIKGAWLVYQNSIEQIKTQITITKNDLLYINIEKLQQQPSPNTVLFEILKPMRFNEDTVNSILNNIDKTAGIRYFSDSHRLLKDREYLIVDKLEETRNLEYSIQNSEQSVFEPIELHFRTFVKTQEFIPSHTPETIHVDLDKVNFPITIRRWKNGDFFYPFGMSSQKKVSDFFINNKLNRYEKESCWILASDDKILWIIGLRLDNRFRISNNTKHILEMSLKKTES